MKAGKTARRRTKSHRPEIERASTGSKKQEKLLRVSNWFFMVKRGGDHNTGQPYTRRKSCATESGL